MPHYRLTFRGRIARTFVGRTAADALYDTWSAYREWLTGPKIDIDEKTTDALAPIPLTRSVFDVVYTREVEAADMAEAVRGFVDTGQIAMVIPLAFFPEQLSIEEAEGSP